MKSKLPIILLLHVTTVFLTSMVICDNRNVTDYQALLKIKSMITQDPYGALTSWNDSLHFCGWVGVICVNKRVAILNLEWKGLHGTLSPYIGNLSALDGFSVGNNSFQGTIPRELGRLKRLRFLYLYQNKFKGVIPANISGCYNLEKLDVSDNKLVGSIPKEIGFLSKLTTLLLNSNNLRSQIPPFLGNITSMERFSVSKNHHLSCSILDTLGNWKSLKLFYLNSCNLSGTIPHYLYYNLSLLTIINLAENNLIGSLPLAIGTWIPNLVKLILWGNQLTGPFPSSVSNCSRLMFLSAGRNMFSGKLTVDFAKLRDVAFISLGHNLFGSSNEVDEMEFIDSLSNCTRLRTLALGTCKFQGVLPRSIGNLSNQLSSLLLGNNRLYGTLPTSIGNLVGLELLHLHENQFIGNIPSTIGNLKKLQVTFLSGNQLSGNIPQTMGNLSWMIKLDLSSNMLDGVIPYSLGNCHNLLELHLDENKLSGKIPIQLLQLSSLSIRLGLSKNNISGSLPTEVGDLKMLSNMDLSDNNLSGTIPGSLGGCVSLSRLSLKGNLFYGMIPPSFRSLKGLVELDISHNNLSGKIPIFLARLQYLNISYNDFEDEVPIMGVFANATSFPFWGNSKLCGGSLELGLPKCKEIKQQQRKLPMFVVIIFIPFVLFTILCLAYAWHKKKSEKKTCQSSMSKQFLKVSYAQLLKATNGFSEANLIGNGGFSSVYKGILNEDDNSFVAIKVLHLQNKGAQRSFIRECEAWRNIRHRNLLKIITSCSSIDFQGNDFKALVYEFMPNGSLHDWLHPISRLCFLQIINILMDVAYALDYIHNHCLPSLVHGDLKPSNILLDNDMVAHVGDFGLARFLGTTSNQNSSTGIKGTIGYAAPEYGLGNKMTSSGDVYSFGILLLEVMTGKPPTDNAFREGLNLHKFASMALPEHVMDAIDINILNVYQEDEVFMQNGEANTKKIEESLALTIKIGVSCTLDSPSQRMDIQNVVRELKHVLDTFQNI